jgi:hypothetical protein
VDVVDEEAIGEVIVEDLAEVVVVEVDVGEEEDVVQASLRIRSGPLLLNWDALSKI